MPAAPHRPPIAVFGSSEPAAGEPLYELARRLGGLLAQAGHVVVSGGYGGVMEGASRGAIEAGGSTLGVTCSIFVGRRPNSYLSRTIHTTDLHERTRQLVDASGGFVVLEGKAGTLAELSLLWALHRAGCLGDKRVVLLQGPWREALRAFERARLLDDEQLALARLVDTPEQALAALHAAED